MAEEPGHAPDEKSEEWRRILTGEDPRLLSMRRGWRLLPVERREVEVQGRTGRLEVVVHRPLVAA